jgi:hypothetical protein
MMNEVNHGADGGARTCRGYGEMLNGAWLSTVPPASKKAVAVVRAAQQLIN